MATTAGSPAAGTPAASSGGVASGAPNGVEQLSADDILAKAKEAGRKAGTVHVTGKATSATRNSSVDAYAGKDKGSAKLANNGTSFVVRLIGATAYVQGNAAFYEQVAGSAEVAKRLTGKWLEGPAQGENFGGIAGFVSLDAVVEGLLKPKGKVTKGEVGTVAGRRTIILLDENKAPLHVALDGEPYPVRIESGPQDKTKGYFDLTEWGAPLDVQAPPAGDTVDVAKVARGGGG